MSGGSPTQLKVLPEPVPSGIKTNRPGVIQDESVTGTTLGAALSGGIENGLDKKLKSCLPGGP
jgi:hypothetical protein